MARVQICDTTLRDGEQTPGVHFGIQQKLDISKRLAKTGVDIIEAGFPASSPGDLEAVKQVSLASGEGKIGTSTISALARMMKADIDAAAEALEGALRRRLHVFIATSDIHLESKLRITREEALRRIRECVTYGKELGKFDEIEFSAEDATRTDPAFLIEPCAPERLSRLLDNLGITPGAYFAVSVRPLSKLAKGKKNAGLTDKDRRLARETADAVVKCAKKHRLTPVILPMQTSQDTAICEEAARFAEEAGIHTVICRPENEEDLIGILGGAQFVVGMRLHALIFASSAGIPVLALSYDPKVASMMKQLRQPYSLELNALLETDGQLSDALTDGMEAILANRDAIAEELAQTAKDMREICREDMREAAKWISKQ